MTDHPDLIAELRDLFTDWDGSPIADASLPRVEIYCGTLRRAADALSSQSLSLSLSEARARGDEYERLYRQTHLDYVALEYKLEAASLDLSSLRKGAEVLTDPIAVHANMLRGTIAKPSLNNIAHLYPEVLQMKQALVATLKHFRWPTSAEHQTRDQVMAALAPFDDPPMTPGAALVSGSREEQADG